MRSGTPATVYASRADYSILVLDRKGRTVYYAPRATRFGVDFFQEEIQTAAAGQTVFDLQDIVYSPGNKSIVVLANGRELERGTDYTETSPTRITMTGQMVEGWRITFRAGLLINGRALLDASQVTYTPAGAGSVASNVRDKLREWVSLSDKGCVGGTNEATKFQAAIDDLPANGGIVLCQALDYSATITSGLTAGNKAVVWLVPTGATLPSGLPGVVMDRGRFATFIVDGESSRNGNIWDRRAVVRSVPANEIDRVLHIEAELPDDPAISTQRELHGLSIRMETDHHEPNGGDIRPIKAIAIGNGGQANIRGAHFLAEGTNGHSGDLTGVLADVFHWDSVDGAYAPVGKAASFVGQLGAGMQSGYTLRSRIDSHFTQKQRPAYGYRVEDGASAVLPEIACFFGHGGGNGDFYRMARSDTDSTVIASIDRLGKSLAQASRSGHQSMATDTAISFTPACTTGFLFVHLEGNSAHWIIRFFRVGSSPAMGSIAAGASAASTTGVLSGTTGSAGNLTISAHTDGAIYIENRSGATRVATWFIVGRS